MKEKTLLLEQNIWPYGIKIETDFNKQKKKFLLWRNELKKSLINLAIFKIKGLCWLDNTLEKIKTEAKTRIIYL